MDLEKNIYAIYSNMSREDRKRLIFILAKEWKLAPNSLHINWFSRTYKNIPEYKRKRTLEIMQNFVATKNNVLQHEL